MTDKKHTPLYHLIESVLLFVLGGIPMAYLTCPACINSWDLFARIWIFNGMMWVLLWKGNEFITIRIDKRVSWISEPGKRFFVGMIAMLLYTVAAVTVNTFVFVTYLKSDQINMTFRGSILIVIGISTGITILILMFFLSKNFLLSWRQSAINEEKLRKENIISQYEALKNQVNPHFLFNTLNALSSLIYEDREKAVQFINKFSDVYRYVLDSKDKEVVPLNDEMKFVKSYIYLLHSRYEKNLEFRMDDSMDNGFVPPMVIQLLVENAVKHNVIADDSRIEISIKREEDYIIVENNMNLRHDGNNEKGIGIENIKSRYSILSDKPVILKNDDRVFSVAIPVLTMQGK